MGNKSVTQSVSQGGGVFIGLSTFENAKKHLETNHPQLTEKIEQCKDHIFDILSRQRFRSQPINHATRQLLVNFSQTNPEKNIVYSANNSQLSIIMENFPHLKIFENSSNLSRETTGVKSSPSADSVVNQAYEITDITRIFYQSVHSINLNQLLGGSREVPLLSMVHFGGKGGMRAGYDNAFWSPNDAVMVYGDGCFFNPLVSEPTVGTHEISHMVTQQIAGTLIDGHNGQATGIDYTGDAGGINEANSDQAAVAALQMSKHANDPSDDKLFRIGQGLFRDDNTEFALRDMGNPGNGYKGAKYLGNDPQEGYGDYTFWNEKSNGVDPHLASAVGNKWYRRAALYLKDFGPTWETVEKVRIAALPLCHSNITYPEYAAITEQVAKRLHPETDQFWQRINDAWKDVKVLT